MKFKKIAISLLIMAIGITLIGSCKKDSQTIEVNSLLAPASASVSLVLLPTSP